MPAAPLPIDGHLAIDGQQDCDTRGAFPLGVFAKMAIRNV
jgi:hypothetical protein